MSFQQGRLLAWMCLSTGWPCGAHGVQILTAPETESPKKAWFIQSGLSDLAVVKGLFDSLVLILYTDLWSFTTVWKEDQEQDKSWLGSGRELGKDSWGRKEFSWVTRSDLGPTLKQELKSGSEAETAEEY